MQNEYIAINGKLENLTKKEAKEKIINAGGFFQQDINSKTTLVINGKEPLKKKKQKLKELEQKGLIIRIIDEQEFLDLLKPKIKIEALKYITIENILRVLTLVMLIQTFRYTNTFGATITWVIASLSILPRIAKKYYPHMIFRVVIPVSLFMIGFVLNIESQKSQIYGTWYVDTMTVKISSEEIKIDVIDSKGRHLLKGTSKKEKGKYIIETDYKNYFYSYDSDNDSLCYLKNEKDCAYYLKRLN